MQRKCKGYTNQMYEKYKGLLHKKEIRSKKGNRK